MCNHGVETSDVNKWITTRSLKKGSNQKLILSITVVWLSVNKANKQKKSV